MSPISPIKTAIKRVLDRYPHALRGSRVFHEIERVRAYRKVKIRPELTDRPELLTELDREGLVVLPGYFDRAVVAEWVRDVDALMAKIRAGKHAKCVFKVCDYDFCRISFADALVPVTRPFFDDPLSHGLARAYVSPDVASYRHEIDYKEGTHEFLASHLPHYDNWRPTVKAFLYLTDVTEDAAPFVYMRRTHKLAAWRERYDREFDVQVPNGRYGHFFPHEMDRLQKEMGFEERIVTGPAGTLIFADFRGVHRATVLKPGNRRILLNNCFGLMNPPVGDPPEKDA